MEAVQLVKGRVDPEFSAVEEAFRENVGEIGPGGAAFSAYIDGRCVADLWAGDARPGVPWERDTVASLMSSTKGMAALVVQCLSSEGLLDVDAPVAKYWPEFAQNGKEKTLVRHLLDHSNGVLFFPHPEEILDWEGGGWDGYDAIAEHLAAAAPQWEPGTKVAYHGVTYGWLIDALVRRVTGRSVGSNFHDRVAKPLQLDAWLGTPDDVQARMADTSGDPEGDAPEELKPFVALFQQARLKPGSILGQSFIQMRGHTILEAAAPFLNSPKIRALEIPASNGTAAARAIARMYAMLAQGGELDGVRIVSPESVELFRTESITGPDALWPELAALVGPAIPAPVIRYGLGYRLNEFRVPPGGGARPVLGSQGPEPSSFGHGGAGGQIGFADPVNRVGIGFVRSHMTMRPNLGGALVGAVYSCLGVI